MFLTYDEELTRAISSIQNEEIEIASKAEHCNMCASWTCSHVKKYNFKIPGFNALILKYKIN